MVSFLFLQNWFTLSFWGGLFNNAVLTNWGNPLPLRCTCIAYFFWMNPANFAWIHLKGQVDKFGPLREVIVCQSQLHVTANCFMGLSFDSYKLWVAGCACQLFLMIVMIPIRTHDDVKWNIFCVTGTLWGEALATGGVPSQRPMRLSFDIFFHLRLNKRLSKQSRHRLFGTPSRLLLRLCLVYGHLYRFRIP